MSEEILLTKEGLEEIESELENLVTIKRKEVAERIKEAISYGDISENSEFDSAKLEQAELEDRISELENILRNVKIIDHSRAKNDKVRLSFTVKVKDHNKDEEIKFKIVGSNEADPFKNKISNESPVGKALLGKKVKETVEVQTPVGIDKYTILEINK